MRCYTYVHTCSADLLLISGRGWSTDQYKLQYYAVSWLLMWHFAHYPFVMQEELVCSLQ